MSRCRLALIAILFAPVSLFAIDPAAAIPPMADRKPEGLSLHGEMRIDNYFWLKEKKDPAVIKYLEAANAYFKAVMKPTEAFQETLYKEFLSRIKQTDQDVPVKDRGYWYYSRCRGSSTPSIAARRERLMRRRKCSSTATRWPRGRSSSASVRARSATTATCWPSPPIRPASASICSR